MPSSKKSFFTTEEDGKKSGKSQAGREDFTGGNRGNGERGDIAQKRTKITKRAKKLNGRKLAPTDVGGYERLRR
jgi:hypothetical protein